MITLKAWQHIYANVEVEQSPQRRRGFQTLFYTRSALTEAEVERMESRLTYFSSDTNPRKLVFYRTDDGKIVVAQCVPLIGEDRFGRGGRYIAHSLIFSLEQFERIGNNPFVIFQCFRFITTVEEALSQGDFDTGGIGEIEIETPSGMGAAVGIVGEWHEADLKQLAMSALMADRLSHERVGIQQIPTRSSLAFHGTAEEIEQAISTAFLFVPPPLRLRCSFDTYFHRCNINATYFWAVGFPAQTDLPNFIPIDANARRVLKEIDYPVETPYQRWVLHSISSGDTVALFLSEKPRLSHPKDGNIFSNQAGAHALSEFLIGQDKNCPACEFPLLRQFFKINSADVETKLGQLLAEKLPPPLANRLFPDYQSLTAEEIFGYFRNGFEVRELAEQLDQLYLQMLPNSPNRLEIGALGEFLKQCDHLHLRLLHACWARQRESLQSALMELSDKEYREFVESALRWNLAQPEYFIVSDRGELFLDIYLSNYQPDDKRILKIVQSLIDAGASDSLSHLSPLLLNLSPNMLKAVRKIVTKSDETPVDFRQTLEEQETVMSAEMGLFRKMKSWFERTKRMQ